MPFTLEEQLKLEVRICPQCRCEITSLFIERCPRCLTSLPIQAPACSRCIHHTACPMASMESITKR